MARPEVLIHHPCLLGEGTVCDAKNHCIYWLDILSGDIHKYSFINHAHATFNVGQMVGAIALRKKGGLIAALQHGFAFVDMDIKKIDMIVDPEADLPGNRFNDGKCDVKGRFWAGTMPFNEKDPVGSLYMLDKNFKVERKVPNVIISNGLAWTPGNKTLYYIDTPTRYVVAYDFDAGTGTIENKRIVIDTHHDEGYPDGMTIDNEGMLWIAFYGGWRVARYNPVSGKMIDKIAFPVANVTCCTFGGPTLEDLFVSTAKKELTADEIKHQPLAGNLFVIKNVGAQGMPAFEFAG